MEEIVQDMEVVESLVQRLGYNHKSKIISNDPVPSEAINVMLPGAWLVDPLSAYLLGSPLGDVDCISAALGDKLCSLEVMGERLQHISTHDGILLLRNSFSISKLFYIYPQNFHLFPFLHSHHLRCFTQVDRE